MKVIDLIKKLQSFDPNLEVICYTEEEELLPKNHILRLMNIEDIQVTEAQKVRGDDGLPSIKLGQSNLSEKIVFINVVGQF